MHELYIFPRQTGGCGFFCLFFSCQFEKIKWILHVFDCSSLMYTQKQCAMTCAAVLEAVFPQTNCSTVHWNIMLMCKHLPDQANFISKATRKTCDNLLKAIRSVTKWNSFITLPVQPAFGLLWCFGKVGAVSEKQNKTGLSTQITSTDTRSIPLS